MANETWPPLTFTTFTSADGRDPGGRRVAAGVVRAAGARGLAEVRAGVGLRVAAGRAVAVAGGGTAGEEAAVGRRAGRPRLGRGLGVATGETGGPVAAGVGGRPVRASAAGRPGYGASVTSARGTSRTPNQARQIDRAVAPHQIARYPTTRRMR